MRRTPLAFWGWLLAAPALAAVAAAAADDADADGPPIPQDPAAMKRRSDDLLAWGRQTLGDAYKQVGHHDPRWDRAAELALDRMARGTSQRLDPFVTLGDIHTPARRAVEAGCDDALILYADTYSGMGSQFPGEEEFIRRAHRASDAMMASRYSPARKAMALVKGTTSGLRQAGKPLPPEHAREVEAMLDATFDLLAQSLKADTRGEFWEARWHGTLQEALALKQRLDADSKRSFDRFDARLARIPEVEALRLALKGQFLVRWAWEARTDQLAALVTDDQFRAFGKRLDEARATLEAAHKLNPRQPNVARTMLTVELGSGDDRAAMETWFRRALELDPHDQEACTAKLTWLAPKWHGDPEGREMAAFGRACAATGNWLSGITLVSADAIFNRSFSVPPSERAAYWAAPATGDAIAAVYDEYLAHYPEDYLALSKYAYFSALCGRVDVSHRMFQRVGDHLTTWSDGPGPVENLKKVRDLVARKVERLKQGPPAQPPQA